MATALKVPKKRAENPSAGREFPEGIWLFTIDETRLREISKTEAKMAWAFTPNAKGNVAYKGDSATTCSLQLGSAQPLEDGQDDPGAQKVFCELTVRDGDTYIEQVNGDIDWADQPVGYKLLIDTALFVNAALALGQAYVEGDDAYPADDFREQLCSGAYNGFKVVAQIKHRHYTKKDGSAGMNVEVAAFSPAA